MAFYFEEAVPYIQANFESYDTLAVVRIDRRNGDKSFQRIATAEHIASEEYLRHLAAANSAAQDIYISMNALQSGATGRTKTDVEHVRHLWMDLDHGGREALDRIQSDLPKPHHVLQTSVDKYQLIWSVSGFSKDEAERALRGLAATYGGDPACTDVSRVLRLPGYANHKTNTPHYVRDVAETPATQREYTPSNFPQFTEQIIRERSQEKQVNAGHGTQSHRDWAWTMRQLESGADPESLIRQLVEMRQDKPHPQYYARRTVEEAMKKRSYAQGNSISQY